MPVLPELKAAVASSGGVLLWLSFRVCFCSVGIELWVSRAFSMHFLQSELQVLVGRPWRGWKLLLQLPASLLSFWGLSGPPWVGGKGEQLHSFPWSVQVKTARGCCGECWALIHQGCAQGSPWILQGGIPCLELPSELPPCLIPVPGLDQGLGIRDSISWNCCCGMGWEQGWLQALCASLQFPPNSRLEFGHSVHMFRSRNS